MKKFNIIFILILLILGLFLMSSSFAASVDLNSTDSFVNNDLNTIDLKENYVDSIDGINYDDLNDNYDNLNGNCDNLSVDYDDLNENYDNLNDNYGDLDENYDNLLNDYYDNNYNSNFNNFNNSDDLRIYNDISYLKSLKSNEYISDEINQTVHTIAEPDLNTSFINFNYILSDANTFYVNPLFDGEESGNSTNPFKSLEKAISSLSTNRGISNLYLYSGVYNLSNRFSITKNFNIIGENTLNTIISANNRSQIFSIVGSRISVNIFNLTLSYGHSYYGGAIYSNQSTVNLVNINFNNNNAEGTSQYAGAGGAFYNEAGLFRVYNCSFYQNTAFYTEASYGGAIYNDLGTTTILNSKFIDNKVYNASYASGGAIYNFNGFLTIYNTSFINNTIDANYSIGGAITNFEAHNVYVINSEFDSNKVYGEYTFAPAIANKAVLFEVINSSFLNNYASGIAFENSTIYNIAGIYHFINSTLVNNTLNNTKKELLSILEDPIVVADAFDSDLLIDLPEKYDLRQVGLITSVKSQGSSGACWAFTTLAALESYLLKYENITYDFSENNMKNAMGTYGGNGTDWSDGGNYQMALAYLLRWGGPASESQDPFSSYSIIPNTDVDIIKHVQGAIYLPLRLDYTDNNQIKYAIMKYGALYTSIYGTSLTSPDYNNVPEVPNHAVAIVGWDDNYSANKFRGIKPPGDGAFIIKNSWGNSYGENGYGYISYYDKTLAGYGLDSISAFAFCDVEEPTNYGTIYQYDMLGNTYEALGYNSNTAWMANQFTAESNNPLSAFGLYTYGPSEYTVDIYVNDENKYSQSGNLNYAGYHTVKFDQMIDVNKGDLFRLNVKLTTYDTVFPIAIESQRGSYSSKANASLNQSFVSPDGINWYDIGGETDLIKFASAFYDYTLKKANVCLKVYSENKGNLSFNISANTSYYFEGDLVKVIFNITNFGDYVSNISINVSLDDSLETIKELSSCSKGIYNSSINLWTISGLKKDESAIVNIVFNMSENKEEINISAFVNSLSSADGKNMTYDFSLYYSPLTRFVETNSSIGENEDLIINNKTIYPFTVEFVNLTLLDVLNRTLSNESIIVYIFDYENRLIDSFELISDENGSVSIPVGVNSNFDFNNYNIESLFNGSNLNDFNSYDIGSLNRSNLNDFNNSNIEVLNGSNEGNNVFLNTGNYTYLISFNGNQQFNSTNVSFNLSINKINTYLDLLINNNSINFSALTVDFVNLTLLDVLNRTVSNESIIVYIYGDENNLVDSFELISDENGSISIPVGLNGDFNFNNSDIDSFLNGSNLNDNDNDNNNVFLNSGNYTYLISFNGNEQFNSANVSFNLSINKINTYLDSFINNKSITIDLNNRIEILSLSNETILFYLYDNENNSLLNRSIVLIIENSSQEKTNASLGDLNGTFSQTEIINNLTENIILLNDKNDFYEFNLNLLKGNYSIKLYFDGDNYYNSCELIFNISVIKRVSKIVFDYNNSSNFINITTINSNNSNNSNLNNSNLNNSNVSINSDNSTDLNSYNSSINENSSIIYYYFYPNDLILNLLDSDLNPLNNQSISLKVLNSRGEIYNYSNYTGEGGKLNFTGLISGKYHISAVFDGNDLYDQSNLEFDIRIIRKETFIDSSDMITQSVVTKIEGRTGEYFIVYLKDNNGNPLGNKSIQIGFNGKIYDRVTDENGSAKLQINLANAGTYTFAICFLGDNEYYSSFTISKITVNKKSISLTVANKKYKASASKKVLTATLKDNNGNLIANKKVSFTINGKTYSTKTNSKGLVSVNVSLSKKATYVFTVKFSGDNSYLAVTKKASLTLV